METQIDEQIERILQEQKELIKHSEKVLWNEPLSIAFDAEYRGEIWNEVVPLLEKLPKEEYRQQIRKVAELDVLLFESYLTGLRGNLYDKLLESSIVQLASSEDIKFRGMMQSEAEFIEYIKSLLQLHIYFERIGNIFTASEFYLNMSAPLPKGSSSNPNKLVKKAPFEFSYYAEKLLLKTTNYFLLYVSKLIDNTSMAANMRIFAGIGMALVFKMNPTMFISHQMLAVAGAPLLGKLLKWTGIYERIQKEIRLKDTMMLVEKMKQPLKETNEVLEVFYNTLLQDFLAATEGTDDISSYRESLDTKIDAFCKGFDEIERLLEIDNAGKIELMEIDDGWNIMIELENTHSVKQPETYFKHF